MPAIIRQASTAEVEIVSGILQEAARWLIERGEPMWKAGELSAERLLDDVEAGLFQIVWLDGEAAGVFKMQPEDPLFWPDLPEGEAIYLHRIAVRRGFAGRGISQAMFAHARETARGLGRGYVRLDCEASRARLRAMYERSGFLKHSERQVGPYFVARYEHEVS